MKFELFLASVLCLAHKVNTERPTKLSINSKEHNRNAITTTTSNIDSNINEKETNFKKFEANSNAVVKDEYKTVRNETNIDSNDLFYEDDDVIKSIFSTPGLEPFNLESGFEYYGRLRDRFGYDDDKDDNDDPDKVYCDPYNPPVPNFKASGRRISETACYRYVWQLRVRKDKSERSKRCSYYRQRKTRIHFVIGGHSTLPSEFPHMGAIGWKGSKGGWIFKCGGSLISDKFVLTAAHCSKASRRDPTIVDPIPKIVRLGDRNIIKFSDLPKPLDKKILRVIVHPSYTPPKKKFDIALMELEEAVSITKAVQPACLWSGSESTSLGTKAIITGWGVVETISRKTSPELQQAMVDLIDSRNCSRLLRPSCNRLWCGVQDHQLCAGKLAGGVDACQGDSGGPLQRKIKLPFTDEGQLSYIIGVTSFGMGCARASSPGVYTRVSSFIDWIESTVWNSTEYV